MKNLLFLICCFCFIACGGSTDSNTYNEKFVNEAKPEKKKKAKSPCFTKYVENLGDLLTDEMIKPYTGGKEYEKDFQILKAGKAGEYNFCQYNWLGDGKRTVTMPAKTIGNVKIPEMTMEVDKNLSIQIGSVKWIKAEDPIADFNKYFKIVSDEDMAKFKEVMDKEIDESEDIEKNSKETSKDIGGGIASILNNNTFEDITGLGDIARWETSNSKMMSPTQGSLHVQRDRERFTLIVDLGDDSDKSKSAAIELAKEILVKCE